MSIGLKYKTEENIFCETEHAGVPFLQYPLFQQTGEVIHGVSTRLGGVSEGIYASMNLGFSTGDHKKNILENYHRFAKAIGTDVKKMTCSQQTHTTNVRICSEEDFGKGVVIARDYTDVDGLITNIPGQCLVTFYADCVPLMFVDPVKKVIASSHSGWRGTVGKIGEVTVRKMVESFGCRPEDILAAVGPSICQDCYEVSEDVILEFNAVFPEEYWNDIYYKKANGKYQLNLWKANEYILLDAGIKKEHLAVTNVCTCCNPELLFSHRASHGKRGSLAVFLALKEEN